MDMKLSLPFTSLTGEQFNKNCVVSGVEKMFI